MKEFNHLKNLCEFLDNAGNFEHTMYEANHELDERNRTDPMFQYNEADSREMFADHIFDLLTSQTDINNELAERITDVLAPAFYRVNDDHYKESIALQNMLRAADSAAEQQCERLHAGDYSFEKFTITIGQMSTAFILGGPQLCALYKFAQHIADENGYEIKEIDGVTTVEE